MGPLITGSAQCTSIVLLPRRHEEHHVWCKKKKQRLAQPPATTTTTSTTTSLPKVKTTSLERAASTSYNKTLNTQYVAPSLIVGANVHALINTFSASQPWSNKRPSGDELPVYEPVCRLQRLKSGTKAVINPWWCTPIAVPLLPRLVHTCIPTIRKLVIHINSQLYIHKGSDDISNITSLEHEPQRYNRNGVKCKSWWQHVVHEPLSQWRDYVVVQ